MTEASTNNPDSVRRLYDLALEFQDRSQRSEARLLSEFEAAAADLVADIGDLVIKDDEDEQLTLTAAGTFRAKVIPEDAQGQSLTLDTSDNLVQFYDPTDVFGDLADAIGEAFPWVASEPAGAETESSTIPDRFGSADELGGAVSADSVLEKYSVNYRGGLPQYPSGHAGGIDFYVLHDAFLLQPTLGSKGWFSGLTIPYSSVTSFEIAQRQVSTFEGILGGLDSRQLNQANNIHIGFRESGQDLVLRLEMLSGTFVMAQAAKCRELVDRLRVHGILDRFGGKVSAVPEKGPDVLGQLAKLGELRDLGIITTEEFDSKKAELLDRL